MRNLIDFINKLLDVISRKIACCESALNKTAFQRGAAFIEASQCCVRATFSFEASVLIIVDQRASMGRL